MNSPTPRTDAERIAYLRTVLQMNPLQRAEEILALRNRYRRIKTPTASNVTEVDTRELRQQAIDGLQQVREQFWKERLTVLQQTLDALPLKPFPDLRKAAQRLKVLASHRQDFPGLAESPGFDPDLFSQLKQILVISPRDAGPLKEAVQESFADPNSRKRALKMLAFLERELPDVYQLEEDWFELLRRERASRWVRKPLDQGQSAGASPTRYPWFLFPVLMSVALAIMKPSSSERQDRPPFESRRPGMRQFAPPSPPDRPAFDSRAPGMRQFVMPSQPTELERRRMQSDSMKKTMKLLEQRVEVQQPDAQPNPVRQFPGTDP
jgi:hypothetical protein